MVWFYFFLKRLQSKNSMLHDSTKIVTAFERIFLNFTNKEKLTLFVPQFQRVSNDLLLSIYRSRRMHRALHTTTVNGARLSNLCDLLFNTLSWHEKVVCCQFLNRNLLKTKDRWPTGGHLFDNLVAVHIAQFETLFCFVRFTFQRNPSASSLFSFFF